MPGEITFLLLVTGVVIIAALYSSVGHGGASGYIAVMILCSISPAVIKPAALLLNIIVSAIAVILFAQAGHFRWRLFWPFAITSIPASFLGGAMNLPDHLLKLMLGITLLFAAIRLLFTSRPLSFASQINLPAAMILGAFIGFVSGITGVGGGIFLSPLLLLLGWAGQRETSSVAALFILVNSISGLAGVLLNNGVIPPFAPWLGLAAMAGGMAGSLVGSRMLSPLVIVRILTVLLSIAGVKLILT